MKPREIIKQRRERLGLTQYEVAGYLGITRSGYANFENGYRSINSRHMKSIARKLGLRVSRLEQ